MPSLQDLNPGDVLGFCGFDYASDLINLATLGIPRYGLSHIGIVSGIRTQDEGVMKPNLIFESTTFNTEPCAILGGKPFKGTQAQKWPRIETYPGRVWVYRLCRKLRFSEQLVLNSYLVKGLGTPYDMIGAERSGGKLWAAIMRRIHGENLSSIFCSEWVAAALRHVGRFDTDDASKWSPNSLIRELKARAAVHPPERVK